MEDARVWEFETSLWTATPEHYREAIDDECLMVVPSEPFILTGAEAIEAVSRTPRWTEVKMSDQRVSRPQEGLIVVAYAVDASKDGETRYQARCSSTYRRLAHEEWRVVQHQQTPNAS
ncbi:MAG: DUF4440 domain-containing protein [Alphaproteobacteria bacterium]|nr:MAG: DUF4440 domain-containing protein [Alphaproteobacteria bacterium]